MNFNNNSFKTVAIIPARGGSKGLKKKNIQLLSGKPLLAHTIESIKEVGSIDHIVVSTDDPNIQKIAIEYGASAPFLRPDNLSSDTATTDEVLSHAILWLEENGYSYDAVLWCHPTMPFRKHKWLSDLIENIKKRPDVDSSFIVCSTHKNYWTEREPSVMAPLSLTGGHSGYTQRQKKQPVYQEECGLGCVTRVKTIKEGMRVGPNMLPYKIDNDLAMVDIHNEFDLWLAEKIYDRLFKINGS